MSAAPLPTFGTATPAAGPLTIPSTTVPKYGGTSFGTQAQTDAVVKQNQTLGDQYHASHLGLWDSLKSIFGYQTSPSTPEDSALGQERLIKPLVEKELETKYAPMIQQVEYTNNRIGEYNAQHAGKPGGPTGSAEGSLVTHIEQPVPLIHNPIPEEAQRETDSVILQNLKQVVHKPTLLEKAGDIGNRMIRGVSGGAVTDAFQEGVDHRIIEAQKYAYPKGAGEEIAGAVAELAGSLPYYMAAEGGAVKIGSALRAVDGVDNFYKTYPYLANFVTKNVGMTAIDAGYRKATGQEYTPKDFMLNLGFQSTFDYVLGGDRARVMAHLDNEAEIATKDLGRMPTSAEMLERLQDKLVPGRDFTYGHLFAEQRLAYKSGVDPLSAMPRKGIPGKDYPAPVEQSGMFGTSSGGGGENPAIPPANAVNVNDVKTDPSRFQFRDDVHPQLGYQESNVKSILDQQGFRPNDVRPLEIGRFPDAAGQQQEYLLNGHNTLEILKRQGIDTAEARHLNFGNEAEAIDYARRANMVSKAPEMLQRVRIATDMVNSGKSVEQVASELGRIKPAEAQMYLDIGKLDPVIQRQVSQGALPPELAGVIGKYADSLGFDVGMQEQLATRVRNDQFTKTRLTNYLDALGKAASATKQELTLFGVEDIPKGFDEIEQKLTDEGAKLKTLKRKISGAVDLGEEKIGKSTLKKLTAEQETLRQRINVYDYLLATGGRGEEMVKPPKDMSKKILAEVKSEIFGTQAGEMNGVKFAGDETIPTNLSERPRPAGPLTPEQANVEKSAYRYLAANKDQIHAKYDAAPVENPRTVFMAGGTGVGKTTAVRSDGIFGKEPFVNIGSDNIKEDFFPVAQALNIPKQDLKTFMNKHAASVHEPSSDASKEMFMTRIGERKNIVFDSNLTSTSAADRIQAALDTGKPVDIVYVHRDPVDAYVNGVVPRMERTGRSLALDEHVARHIEAPKKFLELYDQFKDSGVNFRVFDNGPDGFTEKTVDDVRKLTYTANDVREGITNELQSRSPNVSNEPAAISQAGKDAAQNAKPSVGDLGSGNGSGNGGDALGAEPPSGPIPASELPALRPSKYSTIGAKRTLQTVLNTNPDLLVSRTRGIISDADAIARAAELGVSKDQLLRMPEGTMLTKEQLIAARQMVAAHGEDVDKLKIAAQLEGVAGDATEVQKEYVQSLVEHAELQSRIKGAAAEAGRAVQSFKMIVNPLDKELDDFYDILHTADIKTSNAMAKDFAGIDKADVNKIRKLVNRYSDRSLVDMLVELSTSAKLWSTKTLQVIETSHFLSNVTGALFRLPVAAVDTLRAGLTGGARERFASEAFADFMGMTRGAHEALGFDGFKAIGPTQGEQLKAFDAFGNAADAEASGYLSSMRKNAGTFWQALLDEQYQPLGESQDAIRAPAIRGRGGSDAFIDKALDSTGKVIRLPFRLHNAVYSAFRTIGDAGQLGALAARQAAEEGLRGEEAWSRISEIMSSPPSDLLELAREASKDRNFQAELGTVNSALNHIRNAPTIGPVIKIFFDPFFKIPANIIKKGFSGVNPSLLVEGLRAGGGEASEAIARFSIGSTSAALLTWWALDHTITGEPPTDLKLRQELYNTGWQPHSVRIGDQYYSWDRLEPYSQYFRIATSLADAYRQTGKVDSEMAKDFAVELTKSTLDRSFIRGISDTMNAFIDPQQYGKNWLQNFVWGNVPGSGLMGGITASIDVDKNGNKIVRDPKNFTEFLKSKIPGLSPSVAQKFDSQGRPVTSPGGFFNSMISPVATSKAVQAKSEIDKIEQDYQDYKDFRQQQTDRQSTLKANAMKTLVEWKKLPVDARAQNYAELRRTNPDLFKAVDTMIKNKQKGLSFQDQTLLDLSPPERAAYMMQILKKLPKEERGAMYQSWITKKVMTADTQTEMRQLLKVPDPSTVPVTPTP